MLQPAQLITSEGGIARGTRLQEFGISRRMLSNATRDGSILRLRPGVFAVPSTNRDLVDAASHGGAVTCSRALRLHGVWTLNDDEAVHVWLGGTGRVHHASTCSCVGHFFAGTMQLGLAPLTRLPVGARWLVDLARYDADSGLESLLRLRLHLLGIRLDCQVTIATVGCVDFVVGGRLILETDGRENHDGECHRHKDLMRDAAASQLGYETLRFDYALVVHNWPVAQAAIIAALARTART